MARHWQVFFIPYTYSIDNTFPWAMKKLWLSREFWNLGVESSAIDIPDVCRTVPQDLLVMHDMCWWDYELSELYFSDCCENIWPKQHEGGGLCVGVQFTEPSGGIRVEKCWLLKKCETAAWMANPRSECGIRQKVRQG